MPNLNLSNKILPISLVLAAFILALGFVGGNYYLASKPTYIQMNTGTDGKPVNNINVTATGKTTVEPDIVTFNASYNTKKPDLKTVQEDLAKNNNQIIQALKSKGVDSKDIKTSEYTITPSYRWEQSTGRSVQDGQIGKATIFVKVRNKEKAGEVMDAAVSAGANEIRNISFTIDNMEKAKEEARKNASVLAKSKAEQLANGSGVRLGRLIAISESESNYGLYYPTYDSYNKEIANSASKGPTISEGTLEISIIVNATYGIGN